MDWNELKKQIKSIPQEEITRIEALADGNIEKINELANKSSLELEAWETEALQQIVLDQQEKILYLKKRLIDAEAVELSFTTEINELSEDIEILKNKLKTIYES